MSDAIAFLESLPPGPLYALITALAAIENLFPPVPADTAVALGALLAGRGLMSAWAVFGLTWTANVASAAIVYALARRYGRGFFRGRLGQKLLAPTTLARIERTYERHGSVGIFLSRLLPVWRGVVCPFAGVAGLSATRTLIPVALASALYYGLLTFLVATLGANLDEVLRVLGRVNAALAVIAAIPVVLIATWAVRRAQRQGDRLETKDRDSAGIWIPPPLWHAAALGVGLALERSVPTTLLSRSVAVPLGWALVAAWAVIAASAIRAFRRAGTSIIPSQPSTALVTHGPFRFSRNPMYVGLGLLHLGVTVLADSLWMLALFPAALLVIRYHVVAREERYLEAKFGDSYRQYKSRVRRWI